MRNVLRDIREPLTAERPIDRRSSRGGSTAFTLVELLVVILIVALVSAVTLPTIIPAIQNRQVSEGARILQAALAGARDAATRANAPRGIRLIPDVTQTGPTIAIGNILTCSRLIPIEPAPDLSDGAITYPTSGALWVPSGFPPAFPFPVINKGDLVNLPNIKGSYPYPLGTAATPLPPLNYTNPAQGPNPLVLMVVQAIYNNNDPAQGPNPPTNWFWNVRIGDKIRFADSGSYYTVVGPLTNNSPELFVNDGVPGNSSLQETYYNSVSGNAVNGRPEFLFVVNGQDDNANGYTDEGMDGVAQNLNLGTPDTISEWAETEVWLSSLIKQEARTASTFPLPSPPAVVAAAQGRPATHKYTIIRRPVPSPGSREITLPSACVIDLTTWDSTSERSRLPVNPFNGTVDVLINQAGQTIPVTEYSNPASVPMTGAFYHFWVSDRTDIYEPVANPVGPPPVYTYPALPFPKSFNLNPSRYLQRDRQLVTLFNRTGQVVTNSIPDEKFDATNPNSVYTDAQLGIREAK